MFASILAVAVWGLKLGIDFQGGSLLEIQYLQDRPSAGEIQKNVESLKLGPVFIQPVGDKGFLLRFHHVEETTHQAILLALQKNTKPVEKRFDTIGPTIGAELKRQSILALGLAIAGIVLYITWAFRTVSKPVASWKYGIVTIVALLHDVIIPIGFFAYLGHTRGVEMDTLFISALLTILGFSVHDTIVVFDRIRENLRKLKNPESFANTVNRSIQETLTRSINTSLTVILVLVAIVMWGGSSTYYFALALLVGIISGTYSSIFVASPLLVVWQEWSQRKVSKRSVN